MPIDGFYEIVEMEQWAKDAIDLVEPGYIKVDGNTGHLHFICVDGEMDIQKLKDKYLFTWEGNDECDPASGHGEFTCSGDTLTGRIYIHNGDDSSFVAVKRECQIVTVGRMVSRSLMVVKVKEPFREWVNSVYPEDKLSLKDINDDTTAFLIPEYDDDHERDRVLKKFYKDIFEEQLSDWCTDSSTWPQKRTLALFKKWFDLEFHSVVEDLADDDLVVEDY